MKRIALALLIVAAFASFAEAGIFRKRDGSRRTPVRTVLKAGGKVFGGCANGSCGR